MLHPPKTKSPQIGTDFAWRCDIIGLQMPLKDAEPELKHSNSTNNSINKSINIFTKSKITSMYLALALALTHTVTQRANKQSCVWGVELTGAL